MDWNLVCSPRQVVVQPAATASGPLASEVGMISITSGVQVLLIYPMIWTPTFPYGASATVSRDARAIITSTGGHRRGGRHAWGYH
jgi:hypothetical protein